MVDKALDETLLKRRLLAACEEEMFFAFGLAKKPEDCVLALDPNRKGKMLFDLIRKNHPEIMRGAWGISVPGSGKVPVFTCEKELPKLKASMNKLLRAHKLPIKVRIVMEDGSEEAEGEDDEAASPPNSAPSQKSEATDRAEESGGGDSPQAKARAAFAKLKPKLSEAIGADGALGAEIKKKAADFEALVAEGSMAKARETYQELDSLAELGAVAVKEAETAKQSRAVWRDTRTHVLGEIGKLKAAILKEFADSPMRADIDKASSRLDRVLGDHDQAIRDRLDAYRDAGVRERAGRRSDLNKVIGSYRTFVGSDAMVAELDGNPFVAVDIRGHLESRLDGLIKQLA